MELLWNDLKLNLFLFRSTHHSFWCSLDRRSSWCVLYRQLIPESFNVWVWMFCSINSNNFPRGEGEMKDPSFWTRLLCQNAALWLVYTLRKIRRRMQTEPSVCPLSVYYAASVYVKVHYHDVLHHRHVCYCLKLTSELGSELWTALWWMYCFRTHHHLS